MSWLALVVAVSMAGQSTAAEKSFPERLIDAVMAGNPASAALVAEDRRAAFRMFHFYTSACVGWRLDGDVARYDHFWSFSEKLASIYDAVDGGDALTRALERYRAIVSEHARVKVDADRSFRDAERALAERRFADAARESLAALATYRSIGDTRQEGLARQLLSHLPATVRSRRETELDVEAACRLFREAGDHWREAEVRGRRVEILRRGGYAHAVLEDLERLRELFERTGQVDQAWWARLNIAVAEYHVGHPARALEALAACESHYRDRGSPVFLSFAIAQSAASLTALGRYGEGVRRFHEALDALGEDDAHLEARARVTMQFGGVLDELGLYERAEERLREALELATRCGAADVQGSTLNVLARLELDRGEPRKAEGHLRQGGDLVGGDTIDRAVNRRLLGLALLAREDAAGLDLLEEARRSFERLGSAFDVALCDVDTGDALALLGRRGDARARFEAALATAARFPEVAWRAHAGLGVVREQEGDLDGAVDAFRAAVSVTESILLNARIDALRTNLLGSRLAPSRRLVALLVRRGEIEEALREAQRFRARAAADRLRASGPRVLEKLRGPLAADRDRLRARMQTLARRLDLESGADAREERLENELATLRSRYRDVLTRIALEDPRAGEVLGAHRPLDLDAIRRSLGRLRAAALLYLVTPERSHLWTLRADGLRHHEIRAGEEELRELIDRLRIPFTRFRGGSVDLTSLEFDTAAAHRLHHLLVEPVAERLDDVDRLVIIPDGVLHHVPFEALVISGERGRIDHRHLFREYRDCRYLIERWEVTYLPSPRPLESDGDRSDDRQGRVLVVADPATRAPPTGATSRRRGGPLPSALAEARAIERALGPGSVTVLAGRQATEGELRRRLDGARGGILHLATHAWVDDRTPLFSGIQLRAGEDGDDGVLETHEILDLDFGGALVLLSACETATGPLRRGEGLESVSRAFLLAGARGAIGSLWRVDDSTARLMERFYEALATGATPASALRRAKIALLRREEESRFAFALPYFWAPFVIVGGLD